MRIWCLLCVVLFSSCATTAKKAYKKEMETYRANYLQEFLDNKEGPISSKEQVELIDFYEASPAYMVSCEVKLFEEAEVNEITTYANTKKSYLVYGKAKCPLKKDTIELTLYRSVRNLSHPLYKNYLFVPFKDETNDITTYGGGRYLDIKITDISDQRLEIDFNKAYNPWCAYSDGYFCPVPPPENHLKLEIEAGEKSFKGNVNKRNN